MRHKSQFAALAAAALTLGLTACGGGSSAKDQITSLIKDVGKTPAKLCTTYATPQLLHEISTNGADCLRLAANPGAKDPNPKINSITVTRNTATASITNSQGPAKGHTSSVQFVKTGGKWKVSKTN